MYTFFEIHAESMIRQIYMQDVPEAEMLILKIVCSASVYYTLIYLTIDRNMTGKMPKLIVYISLIDDGTNDIMFPLFMYSLNSIDIYSLKNFSKS